jgi:hypothetical protein
MQEQLSHGLPQSPFIGKTSQRLFMGLLNLFVTTTQGRPGQKILSSTKRGGDKTTQGAWEEKGQVGREPKQTRQDTSRVAMALLWVSPLPDL